MRKSKRKQRIEIFVRQWMNNLGMNKRDNLKRGIPLSVACRTCAIFLRFFFFFSGKWKRVRAECLASRTHLSLAPSRLKNAKTRPLFRRLTETGLQKDKGFMHQKLVHNFIIRKKQKHCTNSSRQSLENNINENNQGSLNTFHTKHTLISLR